MRIGYLLLTLWLIVFPARIKAVGWINADSLTNNFLRPSWKTMGEIAIINVGVWAFDRYIMDETFARITPSSVNRNIHKGPVWDNDRFSTNLLAHPYHGNLYFNVARNNGLNYWQSFPYTLGGSLMWEYVCETEPPAINDLLATTIGGMALGESSFRLSSLFLDDSKKGWERVLREFASLLISPVNGVKRLISGKMWNYRSNSLQQKSNNIPFSGEVEVGLCLSRNQRRPIEMYTPSVRLNVQYGELFEESQKPFEHFILTSELGFSDKQPFFNRISVTGNLWSRNIAGRESGNLLWGLFQYYNYYDFNKPDKQGSTTPYRFSETASVGPGVRLLFPLWKPIGGFFEQHLYGGVILLGGTYTDYYQAIDRDYNLGWGYSLKSYTRLQWKQWVELRFRLEYYRLFTWKGYKPYELKERNLLYLNSQGDQGNTSFLIMNPTLQVGLSKRTRLHVGAGFYHRKSYYQDYHNAHRTNAMDLRFGMIWSF